jgi:hypothetical protein
VAAVLGTLHGIGLDTLLGKASPARELVLAMLIERVVSPQSKLGCAPALSQATQTSTLGSLLRLPEAVDEDRLYAARDSLGERQEAVETPLAKRHLHEASLALYDVSSTYFEGRACPLARFGHSRNSRPDRPQIVFGLLTNVEGCPVAVPALVGLHEPHIEREESELLPMAVRLLSDDDLARIGPAMRERRGIGEV